MKKQKSSRKKIILAVLISLLLVGGCFIFADVSSAADYEFRDDSDAGFGRDLATGEIAGNPDTGALGIAKRALNYALGGVLSLMGILLSLSAVIFAWIIDPVNMNVVINNPSIYTAWAIVRDTLNVAFILVLLFSAFAMIFQVSSFNAKSVLLKLVLMALLVNFSYPIARFIIDVGNMLMYYFVNNLGIMESGNIFARLADSSQIKAIIDTKSSSTTYLISAIIFTFILAITLLIIAILFVIRTVALALLIVFAPLAFTGSIVPGLSSHAKKWWDQLFNYTFFGPIMIFMLYIAASLSGDLAKSGMNSMRSIASAQHSDVSVIAAASFFIIPIVILWIGIGIAQGMSIAGASAVTSRGKRVMGWAGRNLGGARPAGSWLAKKSGVSGGFKQSWNKNVTQRLDRRQKDAESFWAGKFQDKSAGERNMKTRAAQYEKDGESLADLKKMALSGDAAAAYALANMGELDADHFEKSMGIITDPKIKEALVSKTAGTRMDATLGYKFAKAKPGSTLQSVAEEEYGKLNAEGWSKQKNLPEQFKDPHVYEGAANAFGKLDESAKVEAYKRMNGSNAEAVGGAKNRRK